MVLSTHFRQKFNTVGETFHNDVFQYGLNCVIHFKCLQNNFWQHFNRSIIHRQWKISTNTPITIHTYHLNNLLGAAILSKMLCGCSVLLALVRSCNFGVSIMNLAVFLYIFLGIWCWEFIGNSFVYVKLKGHFLTSSNGCCLGNM